MKKGVIFKYAQWVLPLSPAAKRKYNHTHNRLGCHRAQCLGGEGKMNPVHLWLLDSTSQGRQWQGLMIPSPGTQVSSKWSQTIGLQNAALLPTPSHIISVAPVK
jgi:hypothetical protein